MPPISPEVLAILQSAGAGVVPILAYFVWREGRRADRAEAKCEDTRAKSDLMAREMITAMVKTDETLRTVISIFTGQKAS